MNSLDIEELKEFFEEHQGLTNSQLAMVAGTATCTIVDWKRKCGLIKSEHKRKSKKLIGPIPEDWDNKEWFEQAYNKMGMKAIALLLGKGNNWKFVANRLKKYGIPRKTLAERTASKNPCCDEEWLNYYYADRKAYLKWCRKYRIEPCEEGGQRLSTIKCAELAGVSPETITNWLTLYKMKIRSLSEAQIGARVRQEINNKTRRNHRDRFFELYRAGKMNLIIGNKRYSNGKRVDREEVINQRFGTRVRGSSTRTPSQEES